MKIIMLILAFISLSIQAVKCQAVYDFAKGEISTIEPVREGRMASFRIDNINTLLYRVSIKGQKTALSTPAPAVLQELFRLPDPAKEASDATEAAAEGEEATKTMKKVTANATTKAANNIVSDIAFRNEMTDLVSLCSDFLLKADNVVFMKLRRAELTALAKFPWPDYAALRSALPSANLDVSTMQTYVKDFLNAYKKAEAQYKIALATAPDEATKKQIEEALVQFEEAYKGIDEDNLIKIVDDLMALQNALGSDMFFHALAPPVQAEDCDFVEYTITIESDQPNSRLIAAGTMQPIQVVIPVKGGWKTDFSVGLNFSFGAGAKDKAYYLKPSTEGNSTLTMGQNENALRPGIAAMLHAYPRTDKCFAPGFMMGVGAGFKAENTLTASYYLGGSLIFGKKQKTTVSTGVSFLSVDRLKSGFQEGVDYPTESTKISDVTEKTLRPSFFIGVSYNIANRVVVK